jgi:glutamate-ammonia-ligase adenylyltransferase
VGRSAYLALLTESPSVLHELLHWFACSPFITSLLVQYPFLLEILVDQEQAWQPLTKCQLEEVLNGRLTHCIEQDIQDDMLRQFKLTCWLLAARAELYDQCEAVRIGRFLADVAEVIVAEVLNRACLQLSVRYPEIMRVKKCFAIVAYGKLGSQEMNYDSDVDLVFLHTAAPEEEGLVTRLTQKMLHMLTTRLQTGILYSVDTRLRPSGSAGLLVSHLDAFVEYQRTTAWTWEHQALLRTRLLFANPEIKTIFYHLKNTVLFLPRNRDQLREEVKNMRAKMGKPKDGNPIKHKAGGLLDLEFLVQFLVLAYPQTAFVRCTSTLLQLQHLRENQVLDSNQCSQLKRAYRHYHRELHHYLLQPGVVENEQQRAAVSAISQLFWEK